MTEELLSTSAIGALLGYTSNASTRRWIDRAKLVAVGRDISTGEKQYDRSAVERAIAAMPGRGFRSDLRADEGQRRDDDGPADPG